MAFDLSIWKRKVTDRLQDWEPRMQRMGVKSVYAFLATTVLWPVVEAYKRGDLAALMVLGSVLSGVGSNLVANRIEAWKNKSEAYAANELADALPKDERLHAELREVLKKLDVIALARSSLSEDDRSWFTSTLRKELAKLDHVPRDELVLGIKGDVSTGGGDFIQQIYNIPQTKSSLNPTQDSLEAIAEKLESCISPPEAEQRVRRWLQKNVWTKRQVIRQLNFTPGAIRLEHWPIVVYTGSCIVKYTIRKHKEPGESKGPPNKFKAEDWRRVEQTSNAIPIVWPRLAPFVVMNSAEQELAEGVIRAANGLAQKVEYDWEPFDLLARFLRNPLGEVTLAAKRVWIELSTSLYESRRPVWPNLSMAKKRLATVSPRYDSSIRKRPRVLDEALREPVLEESEALISQKIQKAIGKTPDAELVEIQYLDRRLSPLLYPFWVINTRVDEDRVGFVVNGITGEIMRATLPAGLGARLAIVFVGIAAILALAALIMLWTS